MNQKKIEEIKEDYMLGLTYKEIEQKHSIKPNQLKWLIQKHKWKRKSNRKQAQKGNQNAKGNKGGTGAKTGNKNALTTGEYETILYDVLSEEEQSLYKKLEIQDKKNVLQEEFKILTIRELRILKRIKELKDKNKDMNIEKIIQRKYSSTIEKETETTTEAVNIITPLQKLEDALTRIQDQKRKCVDSLHKIENDDRRMELEIIRLEMEASKEDLNNNDNVKDDSFIKALQDSAESAWDDYEEETTE